MTIGRICTVGGLERDRLLNSFHGTTFPLHDVDLSVEADSFEEMCEWALEQGGTIRTSDKKHGTIKITVPKGNWLHSLGSNAIDLVWCRIDGPTLDGRHPSFTKPCDTVEDLERRDFTVNAMARVVGGNTMQLKGHLIDPFGGAKDCLTRKLRFVGDPMERIQEDGLRLLRAWRFMLTKQLTPVSKTWIAMHSPEAAACIGPGSRVSEERVFEEVVAMFAGAPQPAVMATFERMPDFLHEAIFPEEGRLWLKITPTLKQA